MLHKRFSPILTIIMIVSVLVLAYVQFYTVNASEKIHFSYNNVTNGKSALGNTILPQDMLDRLNQKAIELTSRPGWVYTKETTVYDIDRENNGVLPNGQPIPLSHTIESWFHINADGLVFESVSIMWAENGDIVQVSAFANGSAWNSTTSEILHQEPFYLGLLDYGFTRDMQDYTERLKVQPDLFNVVLEGKELIVFTLNERHDMPVNALDYNEPVYGVRTSAYFDEESGLLVETERIMIFEDGTERKYFNIALEVRLDVLPQDETLKYLEEEGR